MPVRHKKRRSSPAVESSRQRVLERRYSLHITGSRLGSSAFVAGDGVLERTRKPTRYGGQS